MKLYYGLSTALIGVAAIAIIQPQAAAQRSGTEVSAIAKKFTVLINGANRGSGVLVNKDGTTYYVLTSAHVVEKPGQYEVITPDNKGYQFDYSSVIKLPGVDLALFPFTSEAIYPVAEQVENSYIPKEGAAVYVAGWPLLTEAAERNYQFTDGRISGLATKADDGYTLNYNAVTIRGMSGGPVLDERGLLLGIHGRGIVDERDRTKLGINAGIPISTFRELAPKAYFEKGKEKLKTQNYAGAIADFNLALRFNPNNSDAHTGIAYAHFATKQYKLATEKATQAIQNNPNAAEAYRLRGAVQAKEGNHREAIADFNQAIRSNPNFADAYALRGVSQAKLKNYQEANEDITQAIRLAPNDANGYIRRSDIRKLVGDRDGATQDQEKAAQLAVAKDENGYQQALYSGSDSEALLRRADRLVPSNPTPVAIAPHRSTPPVTPSKPPVTPSPAVKPVSRSDESLGSRTPFSLALLSSFNQEAEVSAVAISPDGKTLAVNHAFGRIELRDATTGNIILPLTGRHIKGVESLVFSRDGKILASGGADGFAKIWDVKTGNLLHSLNIGSFYVHAVAFTPDQQTLVIGMGDGTIKLWRLGTRKEFLNIATKSEGIYSVAVAPDGKTIASAGEDGKVKLWSLPNGKLLGTLAGHTRQIYSIAFSPDGQTIVSGSVDNTIKIWNARTAQLQNSIDIGQGVYALTISSDGNTVAIATHAEVQLRSLPDGAKLNTVSTHLDSVRSIAFSADGKTFISGGYDKQVKVWQILPKN